MFDNGAPPVNSKRRRSASNPMCYMMLAIALPATIAILTFLEMRTAIASQPVVTIKMLDVPAAFEPGTVTIKVGDTVEWRNVGNEVHHATTDPSMAINCGDVGSPPGAEPFDSGFLKPGATFSHTFKVAGTYRYACAVHETSGMIGKIVVQ
jgi:plastocyanin